MCARSLCTSTVNNEASENAFMLNTLIAPCINELDVAVGCRHEWGVSIMWEHCGVVVRALNS